MGGKEEKAVGGVLTDVGMLSTRDVETGLPYIVC